MDVEDAHALKAGLGQIDDDGLGRILRSKGKMLLTGDIYFKLEGG